VGAARDLEKAKRTTLEWSKAAAEVERVSKWLTRSGEPEDVRSAADS